MAVEYFFVKGKEKKRLERKEKVKWKNKQLIIFSLVENVNRQYMTLLKGKGCVSRESMFVHKRGCWCSRTGPGV